jgi:hypothetical protein
MICFPTEDGWREPADRVPINCIENFQLRVTGANCEPLVSVQFQIDPAKGGVPMVKEASSRRIRRVTFCERLVSVISGEWLLRKRPNGGTVIFLRSLWIGFLIYSLSLVLKNGINPDRTWELNGSQLLRDIVETMNWAGGIFVAAYALLYARFASQWQYLAGVYNQIKTAEVRTGGGQQPPGSKQIINEWKAGFIEDAEDLHLALKRSFAFTIWEWSGVPEVKETYARTVPGGSNRLQDLNSKIKIAYNFFS